MEGLLSAHSSDAQATLPDSRDLFGRRVDQGNVIPRIVQVGSNGSSDRPSTHDGDGFAAQVIICHIIASFTYHVPIFAFRARRHKATYAS
jgi:hypothetical protein